MKFSSRYGVLKNTKNRIINLTAALVLAVTGMSGALPLFLSQKAAAVAPAAGYTTVPFTASEVATNWSADRSTPSGGFESTSFGGRNNVLRLGVDNTNANTSATFYQTEGLQRSIPDSDTVKASLYVDSAWTGKQVRAGLWGVGHDSTHGVSAYPIVEYSSAANGWRIYDSMTGDWTNVHGHKASDTWHTVQISLNVNQNTFGVFLDNAFVGTSPADVTTHLGAVILNSYNYATGSHDDDYNAYWSKFAYGNFATAAPSDVYVDDDYTGPFDEGHIYGYDAFTSVQDGINAVANGGTVHVAPGTYKENVSVNKAVTVEGAEAATTKLVGTTGNTTPLTFATNGATVSGFTITHEYTATELSDWNFNNNGVVFLQTTSGNTLSDSVVTLNRNGVYINNSQNNKLVGNTITDNRTGINMTNTVNGTEITDNTIANNWTIGLVMYSSGLAANLSTVDVSGNTFDANWYTEVLVKDGTLLTGTLDVTNNTFTDSPVTFSTSSSSTLSEPGFAAQHPVVLGGTATKPVQEYPTLRIYNTANATLAFTSPTLDVNGDEVTFTNGDYEAVLPTDAVITPSDSSWNGVVTPPTVVNMTVNLPSGTTQGVALQVGSNTVSLNFDKAARLLIKNEAGKRVGFQAPGSSTFTEITTICGADDQAAVDTQLSALGVKECKMNVGSDLVVWTKHFTTFVTFAATPVSSGSSTTTTSSSSNSTAKTTTVASAVSNAAESAASVLGITSGTASDSTKTPATTNKSKDDKKDASSHFLGLGWWWLLVLAAVAALGYLGVVRRADR